MPERRTALIIGVVIVIALGILAVWALAPTDRPRLPDNLTEIADPAEIQKTIELSHMGILTSTNYVGHKIYVVQGTVKNVSDKALRLIDVKMTFTDYEANTIEEGVYNVFDLKQKPLEPGTQYRFTVNFENLPRTWNYRVPKTQIAKAAY